jgi:hypothetical protein
VCVEAGAPALVARGGTAQLTVPRSFEQERVEVVTERLLAEIEQGVGETGRPLWTPLDLTRGRSIAQLFEDGYGRPAARLA